MEELINQKKIELEDINVVIDYNRLDDQFLVYCESKDQLKIDVRYFSTYFKALDMYEEMIILNS